MDLLRKGSNWYPHRAMGSLVVNEFTAGIIKSVKNSGRVTFVVSVEPGHLHSIGSPLLWPQNIGLGLIVLLNF